MNKIYDKEITTTRYFHDFYCDKCDKKIRTTMEEEDGYYEDVMMEDQLTGYNGCFHKNNFQYKVDLCENCKKELEKFWENKFNEIKKELKERFNVKFYE